MHLLHKTQNNVDVSKSSTMAHLTIETQVNRRCNGMCTLRNSLVKEAYMGLSQLANRLEALRMYFLSAVQSFAELTVAATPLSIPNATWGSHAQCEIQTQASKCCENGSLLCLH